MRLETLFASECAVSMGVYGSCATGWAIPSGRSAAAGTWLGMLRSICEVQPG